MSYEIKWPLVQLRLHEMLSKWPTICEELGFHFPQARIGTPWPATFRVGHDTLGAEWAMSESQSLDRDGHMSGMARIRGLICSVQVVFG
jgi:hypothetical protein